MGRTYDDGDVRDIVSSMTPPTIATRGAMVIAVNDSYLAERGYRREELVGKSVVSFIAPEERERLMQRVALPDGAVSFDKPMRTIAKTKDGRAFAIRVYTSRFAAAEPPDYRVTHVYAEGEDGELRVRA